MGDRRDRFTWQDGDVEVHQPPHSGPQERRPRRVPGAESDSGLPSYPREQTFTDRTITSVYGLPRD